MINGISPVLGYSSYGVQPDKANASAADDRQQIFGLPADEAEEANTGRAAVDKDARKKPGYKSSPEECQTCKERKYQDGSNESDVSFKTPGHIDPGNAASVVLSHERQHVANAFQDASQNNGKVERVSVSLKTDICPECGRTFIAGGETNTQIKYYNEDNPYQKDLKESDADNKYRGMNVDIGA